MKNLIKYSLLIAVATLLSTGCKKELNDASKNPNQLSSVTPSVLLTSSEATIGYTVGGDLSRFEGIFDQQTTNGISARQFGLYTGYIFSTTDFDNSWVNLYASMYNFKDLRDSSASHGYNIYAGIANVMLAFSLASATDVYGDIPYSTGLQGSAQLQPTVDKQKDIYASIQSLLDSGIARLNAGIASPGIKTPSTDDLIYGGDVVKWTKLAYSLKARYYLHLRKVDASAIAKANAALSNGFSSSSDDAYISFGNSPASANPWSQFGAQRGGELSFYNLNIGSPQPDTSSMIATMFYTKDPRITAYIDTNSSSATYDQPSTFYGNSSTFGSGVQVMTYAELMFIKAELDSVGGNMGQAATDYNTAVTASVTNPNPAYSSLITGSTAPFLAAYANETAATISLKKIMTQKWVALFLNPESFTDWRRTGYPSLSPDPGTSTIPRRFLYSQKEIAGNSNISSIAGSITLYSRVWWDVQ